MERLRVRVRGEREAQVSAQNKQGCMGMQGCDVQGRFEQLVTQHHREIYLYITRLTRGSPEADDLFQETFLRAYKAYKRLPADANTRAWLFKIATNLCRNYVRYLQRHQDVDLHEAFPALERSTTPSNGATPDNPEQLLLSHDLEQRVLAIIAGLPLKQKAALLQRKLHGLPYDSIATSLQCSQEAARAHVFQALKKIRAALETTPKEGCSKPRRTDEDSTVRDTL
jgi:RNA polymerase sigma-70 factor (ECF subfamily)